MRVLISSLNPALWLAEALSGQPDLEISVLAAARVDLGDFASVAPEAPSGARYTLHTLPVFPLRPYPYSRYRGGLTGLLRQLQPDLIYHLGEPSELNTAQLVRAARRACPQAALVLFSFENVRRNWRGFPRCLRGRAERSVLPCLDLAAACSGGARQRLIEAGMAEDRVRVIPQAIDPKPYRRTVEPRTFAWGELPSSPHAEVDDRFLIGYVGRLVPEKGVDLLLRALAVLPERFVLCVVGSGSEEQALRALAGELGVEERVRWVGRVERPLIPRYLSSFDALALPSRTIPNWQEQFGAVLVEGMLCETPLVGSSSGAIPEVMGDAGLVFAENDPQALADCLAQLAADPDLAAQLAANGRQRALSEFTIEVQVGRLRGLFEEAVARHLATPASSPARR